MLTLHPELTPKQYIDNWVKIVMAETPEEYERKERELQEQKMKKEIAERDRWYREHSGAPSLYFNESFETYHPTPENQRVFDWLKGYVCAIQSKTNTRNIVFLSGEKGTGKTHLGCAFVRELRGRILTSFELCTTFESCRDFNSQKTRIQYLKEICSYPVLVIDEIGKGIPAIENQVMPFIVNEFYGSGKILLILGNIQTEDFHKIIGEDGADRMIQKGVYFSLIGKSQRGTL